MEFRLYTFCNFYLSQIQGGIQSAHVVHELFNKYPTDDAILYHAGGALREWSKNHKTMIVLNGGAHQDIQDKFLMLSREAAAVEHKIGCGIPFNSFNEDEYSLGGIMTCVGVVLPEMIFDAVDYTRAISMVQPEGSQAFVAKYQPCYAEGWYFYMDTTVEGCPSVVHAFEPESPTSRLIKMVKGCKLF